jgi:predicted aldo/keto reductase-like oxidoreductase
MTKKGRDAFVGLIKHAADRGLGYLDLADMYGAHDYVKEALGNGVDRGDTMLLTKTVARQPDLIRADIERFRHELGTDYLDVVLLHCLTEDDWPTRYAGCLDELARAKDKGLIRAHGVSCHDLGALKQAAVSEWVDVILARVNPAGVKMDGPVEEVVPVLKQAKGTGKGLIGMKIVGEGRLGDRIPESLRFAFREVGVDAVTIGFETPRQIDEAAEHLRTATA